jgi:hypothetical protein
MGGGELMVKQWILVMCAVVFSAAGAGAEIYLAEDFKGTTADDWTFVTGLGAGASLTAASGVDEVGDGWLRLTGDTYNQASFVYYNNAISTANGLVFEFDFVTWSGTATFADGFTLAIFDADATPDAGGFGGSLGYAQRSGIEGLAGGIVGFGFDEFGNFANGTEGRVGGVGKTPNAITIRGSMGETRSDGYEYITTTGTLDAFTTGSIDDRADATIHSVRITIPIDKKLSIEWKVEGDEDYTTLIDEYQCSLSCPSNILFGFTSGTGSVTANHEVRNISVSSVIPEPASILMILVAGVTGLWIRRRFVC